MDKPATGWWEPAQQEAQEAPEGSHASAQGSQTPLAIKALNQGGHTQYCGLRGQRALPRGDAGCSERKRGRHRRETPRPGMREKEREQKDRQTEPQRKAGRQGERE